MNATTLDYTSNYSVINHTVLHPYIPPFEGHHPVGKIDPLYIVIPITVVHAIIFVTGVLGNIITCVVISRIRSMHTATNYYLFSLAVSDSLLLLSGLPMEVYNNWNPYPSPYPFDNTICVLQGLASETSVNATVLTITAFTIERYVAICHPFLSHTMSKLSRAVKFILGIWIFAILIAIPQILDLGINEEQFCTTQTTHVFLLSTVLVFVLPMSVITILYVLIGRQLRRQVVKRGNANGSSVRLKHNMPKRAVSISARRQRGNATMVTVVVDDNKYLTLSGCSNQRLNRSQSYKLTATATTAIHKHPHLLLNDPNHLMQKATSLEDGRINYSAGAPPGGHHNSRHVVNMLIAVVVAFFICWAPFHAQRLFAIYAGDKNQDPIYSALFKYITYVSGVLYYMSTCINPLLYNIMSNKFREAFKETIARSFYRSARGSDGRHHRGSLQPGRLSLARSLSQRSCNSNSHSTANTCSSSVCSIQPLAIALPQQQQHQQQQQNQTPQHQHQLHPQLQLQLQTPYQYGAISSCNRYTMTDSSDLNALKSSRRPLVVSFRRHLPKTTSSFELGTSADKINKVDCKYPSELHRIAEQSGVGGSGELCINDTTQRNTMFDLHAASPSVYASDRTIDRKAAQKRCVSPNSLEQTPSSSSQHPMYKSPYESPEMTANCKELEHNLQKILEDLVLYRQPLNRHNDKLQ